MTERERKWAVVKADIARINAEIRALPEDERPHSSEEDLYDPETGLPA